MNMNSDKKPGVNSDMNSIMISKMKKVNLQMSLLMGVTLSFFLSLAGILSSGQFSLMGFISSFIISFVISLIIGVVIPHKRISDSLVEKLHLEPYPLGRRLFESFISDVIYTPIITVCMVSFAYLMAVKQAPEGYGPAYGPMLGKGMILSMAVGYLLIFFFMPLYMKLVLKKNGIVPGMGPIGRPEAAGGSKGVSEVLEAKRDLSDPSSYPSMKDIEDPPM